MVGGDSTGLIQDLVDVAMFEDAAGVTLRALLRVSDEAIAAGPYAGRGRALRGTVHLRPGEGYRRLVIIEHGDKSATAVGDLTSATAFRWVSEHRCPVLVDVTLGVVTLSMAGSAAGEGHTLDTPEGTPEPFGSEESRARLLTRDVTHLAALPIRAPAEGVCGMISLEASCRAATGRSSPWAAALPTLTALSAIAAPYLWALPGRPAPEVAGDELLPVVGPSMAGVVSALRIFAQQEETVLLSGPTGAGKSRLARWAHAQSERRDRPFETLDLSTVPDDLQMAELFGWKRGAFTGATRDTPGCIGRAERGTLFIDEIDKLSLKAQAGLLRVLEERRYRPLGEGAGDRNADVRFVVGTNADLHDAVRAGRFREDLYYRINVLPVRVPPLRERTDEIPAWARYMLDRRHRAGRASEMELRLEAQAERILSAQAWPGNLRQLDNIVRRAYALALIDHRAPAQPIVIQANHVERALAFEGGAVPRSLLDQLHLTATTFAIEAQRRRAEGGVFDLDHADALRGFVLGTLIQQLGSREEAFRALGREAVVQNRNHMKALRRELERVGALCRALGVDASPFAGLLEEER